MEKINFKNVIAYIQGNIRYELFYSEYKSLIRSHIIEQIEARIKSMNQECYDSGSCIKCGCRTTHLQMANKPCDGACYPPMVNRDKWNYMKKGNITVIGQELWQFKHGIFKKLSK